MPIGETNINSLLRNLQPILSPETYVFTTTTQPLSSLLLSTLQPILIFHEAEGLTLITTRDSAQAHSLEYTFPCRKISLKVHSSLEAVGMMTAISSKLTELGVTSNVVSGYYHDHIFVAEGKEEITMKGLEELTKEAMKNEETWSNVEKVGYWLHWLGILHVLAYIYCSDHPRGQEQYRPVLETLNLWVMRIRRLTPDNIALLLIYDRPTNIRENRRNSILSFRSRRWDIF